jgi:hypothetical protein
VLFVCEERNDNRLDFLHLKTFEENRRSSFAQSEASAFSKLHSSCHLKRRKVQKALFSYGERSLAPSHPVTNPPSHYITVRANATEQSELK